MKNLLIYLLIGFSSLVCGQIKEDDVEMESYLARQDSLRTELLKAKYDSLLVGSLVEEHYMRGLVTRAKDRITFILPFTLHGIDCGVPNYELFVD